MTKAIQLVSTHHSDTRGRWRKMSSHWLLCTQQDHQKCIWPIWKVEDIFAQLNGTKYFSTLDLQSGCHHIPWDESSIPKTAFTSPFGKYECIKVPFWLTQAPTYFQELMTGVLKDFPFTIGYLVDIIIFSRMAEEHLDHISQVLINYRILTYQWNSANATSLPKRSSTLNISSAPQASDLYHWRLKPSNTCTHLKQLSSSMHFRMCWILQKIHQGLCTDGQATNLINSSQGQV